MKKTQGKTMVRRRDYDMYSVRLPFSMIRSRQRDAFVRRELEKRHPRFSEKCCADTRLSLHKDGLTADIAVMDKVRLAQYKKEFPGKRLFLEQQPERAVFKNARGGGKALALGLLVCALLGGVQVVRNARASAVAPLTTAQTEPVEQTAFLSPEHVLLTVLAAITRKGGKLSALVWQSGSCRFAVTGCHPEDIASDEQCTVSYKNNEPHFELALPVQHMVTAHTESAFRADTFVPALRHALLSYGAVILSEQIAARDVAVHVFCTHDILGTVLKCSAEQAELHGWSEAAFSLQGGENGGDITMTFVPGTLAACDETPLRAVATYASLLMPEQIIAPVRPRKASVAQSPVIVRDKVGEIRRMDGSRFVYYRMSDGRIICEQEKVGG